jgi:hypothetical protein
MEQIMMPTEELNLEHAELLCRGVFNALQAKWENAKIPTEVLKNLKCESANSYVCKYIYPLTSGKYMVWQKSDQDTFCFVEYTLVQVKEAYLNRIREGAITHWMTHVNKNLYKITSVVGKPRIFDGKINLAGRWLHENYKKYNEYTREIKKNVQKMLDFIKEFACGNDDEQYKLFIKYIAATCQGKKCNFMPYLRSSAQGIGKSSVVEFIRDYVIGNELSLSSSSKPLTTGFNMILCGKMFVYFEELPVVSTSQWFAVDSVLKDMITNTSQSYTAKGKDEIKLDNVCTNYMALTNNDAIPNADGRRILCLDLSLKYQENKEFFAGLRQACYNNVVGEAFFSHMNELDTSDINTMPMVVTKQKLNYIHDRLDTSIIFLKECFLFKYLPIKMTLAELFKDYEEWHRSYGKGTKFGKILFSSSLTTIGFEHKKCDGNINAYDITHTELEKVFYKRNFIHELDEYEPANVMFKNKNADEPDEQKIPAHIAEKLKAYKSNLKQLEKEADEKDAIINDLRMRLAIHERAEECKKVTNKVTNIIQNFEKKNVEQPVAVVQKKKKPIAVEPIYPFDD